jgi:hypothetical protein
VGNFNLLSTEREVLRQVEVKANINCKLKFELERWFITW